ncbi:hypothetical protein ASM33_01420 [Wolbachia endosymbiont of Folsomia candida]|nr:hypothetical protein ASM33_01420 [Wolbachia endosymbiont of Folsomia candida]
MGGEQNLEFGLIGVSVKSASPFLRGILALMPHIIKIQVSRTGMTKKGKVLLITSNLSVAMQQSRMTPVVEA